MSGCLLNKSTGVPERVPPFCFGAILELPLAVRPGGRMSESKA